MESVAETVWQVETSNVEGRAPLNPAVHLAPGTRDVVCNVNCGEAKGACSFVASLLVS
jgi:hypothetical protein